MKYLDKVVTLSWFMLCVPTFPTL